MRHLNSEEEVDELKREIEQFRKEKERVRQIIGQVGGMPTFNTKLFNAVFIMLITVCLVVSLWSNGVWRLAMVALALTLVSLKLIYLIYSQSRVNHFQLWILTSIEWRLNELIKKVEGR